MIIKDLSENEIKIGLKVRSLKDPNRFGTIVEIDYKHDNSAWILWEGDNKPLSAFYGNDCQCEVVQCPACGGFDVETNEILYDYCAMYGEKVSYKIREEICNTCKESFRLRENIKIIEEAIKTSDVISVINIIDYFEKNDISNVYIERVLHLAYGTLERCKEGKFSEAELALLRVLRSFPRLLLAMDHWQDKNV